MLFDSQAYYRYLGEFHRLLFDDMSLEDIFAEIHFSHTERRYVNLYVMRDKDTFFKYFEMQDHYGLTGVFDQVLSALFYQMDHCPIKKEIVAMLGVTRDMIKKPASLFAIKEVTKDLHSFSWYVKKRSLVLRRS